MEAATLRHSPVPAPARRVLDLPDEWDWVYEDPDLAPYRASRAARKETPLWAFNVIP